MDCLSLLLLGIVPLAWAQTSCGDTASCYEDLGGYCRVRYPVEPITITATLSDYTTVTTTETTTTTYVGIKDVRAGVTAAFMSPYNAHVSPTPTAAPTPAQEEDAMIKKLCRCIQGPAPTETATITDLVTSTVTRTSTEFEFYCTKGCDRRAEYCDTIAGASDDEDIPDGICRPTGNCETNDDCATRQGKKREGCSCLIDDTDPALDRGYCIRDGAAKCKRKYACAESHQCDAGFVCLQACAGTEQKYCVEPRTYESFCEVAGAPDRIFAQRQRPQKPLSGSNAGAKYGL